MDFLDEGFGCFAVDGDEEALVAALKKHGIDYYLVWGAEERLAPGPLAVKRFPEVTGGAIKGLRVYAMAKPES